jgi:transposase-like protein
MGQSVTAPNPGAELTQAELAAKVIRLKRSGMTYDAIALHTGVNRNTAWRWVRAALRTATLERSNEAELLRTEQVERLETLLAACWPAALEGSVPHIAEARRLVLAISDLYGIRQPVQFQWGVTDVERALAAVQRAIAERTAGAGDAPHVIEGQSAAAPADLAD